MTKTSAILIFSRTASAEAAVKPLFYQKTKAEKVAEILIQKTKAEQKLLICPFFSSPKNNNGVVISVKN